MNFEFVKQLDGLQKVYRYCNNAEELAKSMPDSSEAKARMSAESIAKYVYTVAHMEELANLTFAEILNDPIFKKYIGRRDVIDAFHFVRKRGNTAVHDIDAEISSEEAIDVLEHLHFVIGEVACRMKLISTYPVFDRNLIHYSGIKEQPEVDSSVLASEMYKSFLDSEHSIDRAKELFEEFCSPFHMVPGYVDEFEMIVFKHKPKSPRCLRNIQNHFWSIAYKVLKAYRDGASEKELSCKLELAVNGEKSYYTDDSEEAIRGILYDLNNADGFTITCYYSGPSLHPWFTIENSNVVELSLGSDEEYTYRSFEFLYSHGVGSCQKKENGEDVDYKKDYSPDIIYKEVNGDWWAWDANLVIEFDFEKYKDIIMDLHEAVRKHVPAEELPFCESNWEGEEAEHEIILDGLNWCPQKIGEVQAFLDEVNHIIEPIKDECEFKYDATWYMTKAPFAIAELQRIDGEFKVVGTIL